MSRGRAGVKTERVVESILVSQPAPENGKSPYYDIRDEYGIKVDFRPFIHVEGVDAKEFRKSRIYIDEYSAIILTSRNAIEHYFRICEELRIKIDDNTKYFCKSEAIALYLQKFIQYRKRKIFFGNGKTDKLLELICKHKANEKFLLPCSDVHNDSLSVMLDEKGVEYTHAVIYRTVCSDLSDLSDIKYDMIVFFSPSGVESLYKNFPEFKQTTTRIAAWGLNTAQALEDNDLNLNIKAPLPETPSMTMAIRQYLKIANKK